jgi:large subunit ribosomal protein L22
MAGLKTNEREGTRAVLRHARVSPYKVREVLDLVRGKPVHEAEDILRFSERDAAFTVGKVLHSAVANAENNDELDPEELYVAACFADEGTTIKRWRPRARGRATRIRKRTSHITVIVSRMPLEELQRQQARRRAEQLAQRARRVAGARRAEGDRRSRAERRHGTALEEQEPLEDAGLSAETAENEEAAVDAESPEADEAAVDAESPEVDEAAVDAESPEADEAAVDTEPPEVDAAVEGEPEAEEPAGQPAAEDTDPATAGTHEATLSQHRPTEDEPDEHEPKPNEDERDEQ